MLCEPKAAHALQPHHLLSGLLTNSSVHGYTLQCREVLSSTCKFVFCRMEDPHSSPLSELSKWRQRHCLLSSVVEQLKVKETRAVFAVLVAAKSRALKKWKNTDTQ